MAQQKIGFIVDSSIGLFGDEILSDDTRQVFFNITDKNNVEYEDNNLILSREEILKQYLLGNQFKTSAVSPGKVEIVLEELLETYDKVILFTVSSGLSCFYDSVQYLLEDYKDRFYIVDTKEVGYSIATMLSAAKTMLNQGKDFFEVLEFCRNYYLYNFTSFTCENWSPLVNSGRVPALVSKFLNALKTRPIINFDIKNKLGGVVKSFEAAVEKIFNNFKKVFGPSIFKEQEYIVFYNNKIEESKAEYIRNKIVEKFNITKDKIIEMFVPNLVLIYTANGSFGLHIRGKTKASGRDKE
ncbi:MAG: DegV family protein [Malacoplasma sp.]|nr:DegV family protein [Malacoplasma sp.]